MEAFYTEFQNWIMRGCLCALAVLVPLWLLMLYVPYCIRRVKDFWSCHIAPRGFVFKVCVALFFGINFYLGATKPSYSRVTYDGGIKAGATANSITNDTVSITWQRDLSGGVYVPESAAVYIDYREIGETNGVWALLAETTVGAWSWSGTVQNATNYNYNVWAYYIPPEPVHTNGVWTYKTMRDRAEKYVLPLRATVTINNRVISPPNRYEPPPYDAEVEYLQSSGTQYIDTGVIPTSATRVQCAFSLTSVPSDTFAVAFGAFKSQSETSGFALFLNNTVPVQARTGGLGKPNIISAFSVAKDFNYEVYLAFNTLRVNGQSYSPSQNNTWTSLSSNMYIFSGSVAYESRRRIPGRFYYFKVWDGYVLIRDYIAVRRNGVGYMYDRVSKSLYGNAGTGAFAYGSDTLSYDWETVDTTSANTFTFSGFTIGEDWEWRIMATYTEGDE